jgi:hypothetical protein
MPYEILRLPDGYFAVYNPLTGSINAKHTTYAKARAQIRVLHSKGYVTGREHPRASPRGGCGGGPCISCAIGGSMHGAGTIPSQDEIYLLLSEEAYRPKAGRAQMVQGANSQNFTYDPAASTERTAVYVSAPQKRVIVAHRGTVPTDQSDLKQDALIAIGQFSRSDRLKRALQTVSEVAAKYPGYKIENTGHSLGGRVASEIAKSTGQLAVTFNLGGSPADIASSLKNKAVCAISNSQLCKNLKNQRHYSTGIDPVSFTSALLHGSVQVRPEGVNVHSLSQFHT